MTDWDPAIVGRHALDMLHRRHTEHGHATPYFPAWLTERFVSGQNGLQVITDPSVGTTYMCKSFWDDFMTDCPLFKSVETRADPFLLYGGYPGFKFYLSFAFRYDDFALFLECRRVEDVPTFVSKISAFLSHSCQEPRLRPLREVVYMGGLRNTLIGERFDTSDESSFSLMEGNGWKTIVETEDTDAALSIFEERIQSGSDTSRSTAELIKSIYFRPNRWPEEPKPAKTEVTPGQASPSTTALDSKTVDDAVRQVWLSPELTQWAAWRLMSDVHRRHPAQTALYMDYYPSGAPMLSIVNVKSLRRASLNFGGGIHLFTKSGGGGYVDPPWYEIVHNGLEKPRSAIQSHLKLSSKVAPKPSTPQTIVSRVIASFLGLAALSGKVWMVEPIWDVKLFRRNPHHLLDGLARHLVQLYELDTPQIPLGWMICDHEYRPRAALSQTGFAITASEGPFNLFDRYHTSGKKIGAVAASLVP